jgi:hypothetical protein
MTRFSKLHPDGSETDVRYIKQSDMLKCPHCIIAAEHYRNDGSCKCDDPNDFIMKDWGYAWNAEKAQWM